MKFMHLSDLHIGIHLHNYDLKDDQQHILNQIIQLADEEQPDAVVIAGDIYDKSVPSAEAVEVFDGFITGLRRVKSDMPIMLIAGNHDSPQRIDCFRNILKEEQVYMVGLPPQTPEEYIEKVTVRDEHGPVHFYLLPFVKPFFLRGIFGEQAVSYDEALHLLLERENIDLEERNVLVSHQFFVRDKEDAANIERAETEVYTIGNIDSVTTDCLAPFDYVALGHLHKPMRVERDTIRYCGTPMAYSISEENQEKGVLVVTLTQKGDAPVIRRLPLIPLRQVRTQRGTLEEVTAVPSEDYIWVSLTERTDLDITDMQQRLREAFPHLLGVRNEYAVSFAAEDVEMEQIKEQSAFELFMQFCPELDREEQQIIKDVINKVQGEV
ncbi:MAG: exonuclease SbcCD subunit D [Lachnospiraceae bacterium]|nr:exonuclease SbcCD subunit D [Lachnospiraceae bacterium]